MTENETYKTALNKAMVLCASREYCSEDIRRKLMSWGVKEPETEKIIGTLTEEKFIDDMRYARAFVKDRFRQNKWGRIKIASELRIKKLPQNLINEALEIIDEDDYRQILKELITSHRRSVKAKNNYDLKGKLMRYGLSKGFESDLLYDLMNDLD